LLSSVADDLRTNYVVSGKSPFKSSQTFNSAFKRIDRRGMLTRGFVFGLSTILFAGVNGVGYDTLSKPLGNHILKMKKAINESLSK